MEKGKHPADSAINDHTYRIFPNDLNSLGTVFGGMIMSVLDRIALVVAERHSERTCVTASVDAIHFLAPAGQGDNLIFKACVNRSWNSSMEIGVKVIAESPKLTQRHILSAYFTFVALDAHRKPAPVPPLLPQTTMEKRRFAEAEIRKRNRIKHKQEVQEYRQAEAKKNPKK